MGTKLEPEVQIPGLNAPPQILAPRWDLQYSAQLSGGPESRSNFNNVPEFSPWAVITAWGRKPQL